MALPPKVRAPDYELISYFTLDRVGRYPVFSFATAPVNTYRTGPHEVLAIDGDVIAFAYEGTAPLPGATLRDPDTLDALATVLEVVEPPEEEPVEGATYVRTSDAITGPFLCEPLNEFGQFIAELAGDNTANYWISAQTPEGVALMQSLLVQIGVQYVGYVLAAMGIEATEQEIIAGVVTAAQAGDDVQAAVVRTLEGLVTQHAEAPVAGLASTRPS